MFVCVCDTSHEEKYVFVFVCDYVCVWCRRNGGGKGECVVIAFRYHHTPQQQKKKKGQTVAARKKETKEDRRRGRGRDMSALPGCFFFLIAPSTEVSI